MHLPPDCFHLCALCCLPLAAPHKERTPGRDLQAGLQQHPVGCQGLQPFPYQAGQVQARQPYSLALASCVAADAFSACYLTAGKRLPTVLPV